MKNRFLKTILITLMFMTSLYAQNTTIANEWEASPQYKEYLQFMEAGDLKSAMKIKKDKVDVITLKVMKPYLSHFKEKYREMFAKKVCDNLPIELNDMLNVSFFKAKDILNIDISDEKSLQTLARNFYVFFKVYNEERGEALFFANKISKSFPKIKNTELMNILEAMAKESDIEAAKTPEQKQKDYDNEMIRLDKKIEETDKKIERWKKIIKTLNSLPKNEN
jgi:hypothetical protein